MPHNSPCVEGPRAVAGRYGSVTTPRRSRGPTFPGGLRRALLACCALVVTCSLVPVRAEHLRARPSSGSPDDKELRDDVQGSAPDAERSSGSTTGLSALDPKQRATRQALDRGLAWLAERQHSTTNGGLPSVGATPARWAPVGVTALGALAFLADGNSPRRGEYGREVDAMITFLADLADMGAGSPTRGYISRQGDNVSRTHGHGYATLVLAEAWGMGSGDERLLRVLVAAVRRIEQSQGSEGGWGYQPQVDAFHEGSVTIAHVQALRAARNAGIAVNDTTISRAEAYVKRLQKEDGTFRYTLDDERSSVALTAAAISTLNATGHYDDPEIQVGVDAIFRGLYAMRAEETNADFPFYMRLYLAQSLWQLSDPKPFQSWWETERKEIVLSQRADGSWGGSPYGDCYATAINCLVLSIPEGVLPIFQR